MRTLSFGETDGDKQGRDTWGKKWPPKAASSSRTEGKVVPFERATNMEATGMDVVGKIP